MTNGRQRADGLALINVAVALFGLAGVLGKLSNLSAPVIAFGRIAIAGLALMGVAAFRRSALRPHARADAVILIAQGIVLTAHWTMFFQAIAVSSVAIGLLSYSSFPLFVVALEALLLRRHVSRAHLAAALLVIPGVALLVPSFQLGSGTARGVLWGIGAGASFAILSLTNRHLARRYPSITISLYQDAVAALVLAPTLALAPRSALLAPRALVLLLLLGLCCTALAHTIFIAGMRSVGAQRASLLAALEPVWGILFGILLLGEVPSIRTCIGGGIILLATLLPSALSAEDAHPAEEATPRSPR